MMTSYQTIFYDSFFDSSSGHVNAYLSQLLRRFQRIIPVMKHYLNTENLAQRVSLEKEISELIELYKCSGVSNAKFYDFLSEFLLELGTNGNESSAVVSEAWSGESVSEDVYNIPHMLHEESYKYYKWLGRTHSGRGAIVELGCWMGASTSCILEGLSENEAGRNARVSVFDSFLWYDNMTVFQNFESIAKAGLREGDSFLWLFEEFCAKVLDKIDINRSYLYAPDEERGDLPELIWKGGYIETIILDFSPELSLNRRIFDIFSPFFIPKTTVLVYNQFGNLGASELRKFLRQNVNHLEPIHKPDSAIKSFLFLG